MKITITNEQGDEFDRTVTVEDHSVDIFEIAEPLYGALVGVGYHPKSVAAIFNPELDLPFVGEDDMPPEESPPLSRENCDPEICETVQELKRWFREELAKAQGPRPPFPTIETQGPRTPTIDEKFPETCTPDCEVPCNDLCPHNTLNKIKLCDNCAFSDQFGAQKKYGPCAVCYDHKNWREK
jgi:hypothetical protein